MDEGGGEYESSNFHVCADNIPPFRIPAIPASPINFNDSISKGRNKIACNNNREGGSRGKALIDTRPVMRIHVCISCARD